MRHGVLLCMVFTCLPWCGAAADTPAGSKAKSAGQPVLSARQIAATPIEKLNFDGLTLAKAVNTLRTNFGASIVVDYRSLGKVGVKAESLVKASGANLTFANALDLTLARAQGATAPLAWTTYGNRFVVTTQANVLKLRQFRGIVAAGMPRARPIDPNAKPARPARHPRPIGRIGSLEFDQMPLGDVIEFFRDRSGMNIVVNWRALDDVGVTRQDPVTLKVNRVALLRALDMVLESFNAGRTTLDRLYWMLDEGVLTIATGEVFDREMITRVYDVSDLLAIVPNFAGDGLDISLGTDGGRSSPATTEGRSESPTREQKARQLIDIVTSTLGEEFWQPVGKGSVKIFKDRMVVSQSRLGFLLMGRRL